MARGKSGVALADFRTVHIHGGSVRGLAHQQTGHRRHLAGDGELPSIPERPLLESCLAELFGSEFGIEKGLGIERRYGLIHQPRYRNRPVELVRLLVGRALGQFPGAVQRNHLSVRGTAGGQYGKANRGEGPKLRKSCHGWPLLRELCSAGNARFFMAMILRWYRSSVAGLPER